MSIKSINKYLIKSINKYILINCLIVFFSPLMVLGQNGIYTYFINETNQKDNKKPIDLKQLEGILVKNNSNDVADVLFILKGNNGKTLWEIMSAPMTIKKDSSQLIKIDKNKLNNYLALNNTIYIDEEVSSRTILQRELAVIAQNNTYEGKVEPFKDALIIAEELRKKNKNQAKIDSILSHYQGFNALDTNNLHAFYSDNLFILKNIYPYYASLERVTAQSVSNEPNVYAKKASTSAFGSLAQSVGGINATLVADAFAKIIIKRFKQDLNEIFFDAMREEMDKNVELRTLLPRTHEGLQAIDRDIFQFNQFIEGLRQKMEEDLSNVFANTNDLLETDKYKAVFKENQTLRAFLTTVTQFSDGLIRKQHPGIVIENLHFSDAFDYNDEGKNLKARFKTVQLLSRGLQSSNTEGGYWVQGLDSLNLLFKYDAKACQIWLGLLHTMAVDDNGEDVYFDKQTTLRGSINKLYDERNGYYEMENYVKQLMRRINQINMSLNTVNSLQQQDNKIYWDKLITLYDNTISLIKFAPTITEIFDNQYVMPQNWYKGIYIAEILPHIYTEMQSRNYNAAIQHISGLIKAADFRDKYIPNYKKPINTMPIYQKTMVNKSGNNKLNGQLNSELSNANNSINKELSNANNSINKELSNANNSINKELNTQNTLVREYTELKGNYIKDSLGKFILIKQLYLDSACTIPANTEGTDKFIKYASFAASLVLAKNSDEIANLLETTMVPPGSTRMKEYGILLGINSYLGVQYVGKEQNGTPVLSISAPIGLNLSFGIPRKPKYSMTKSERFWSFVSPHNVQAIFTLVDVGAIVGLRFNNNQDSLPKIKLENIFSPGVILQFGRLFNLPLNIGVGYQSQPRLYGIKGNSLSFQNSSFRWNFNVSWDIPLWNVRFWEYKRD